MDILLAEQCKRLIFVNKLRKGVFLIFDLTFVLLALLVVFLKENGFIMVEGWGVVIESGLLG